MPQTRAQKEQTGRNRVAADPAVDEGHHQNAPPPPPGPPRQRKAAKSKTHAGNRNLRRSISTPTLAGTVSVLSLNRDWLSYYRGSGGGLLWWWGKRCWKNFAFQRWKGYLNLSSISYNQQYQYFSWAFLTRKASFSQQISWLIFRARSIVKDIQ